MGVIFFLLSFGVLTTYLFAQCINRVAEHQQPLSPLLQIETACALLHSLQHAFLLVHYARYASDGMGHPWAMHTASVLVCAADVLFTLFLLFLSKGWYVTRSKLKRKTQLLQGVVTVSLVVLFSFMFLVELNNRDPAATYHAYESVSARIVAA